MYSQGIPQKSWSLFFFFFFTNLLQSSILFIHLWLLWVFVVVCGLSLATVSGYCCLVARAPQCSGFSCCRAQALGRVGSVVVPGLAAPQHVRSSWTQGLNPCPCIGRQILNHWATGEVPHWECPPPGDLPDSGIEPASLRSPALADGFLNH